MTTSVDALPAPSYANRCWHSCSFTKCPTNSRSNQRDRECLCNMRAHGRPSWGWAGLWPLSPAPALLSLHLPESPAAAPGVRSAPRQGPGTELVGSPLLLLSPGNQELPQRLLLRLCILFPLSELDSMPLPTSLSCKGFWEREYLAKDPGIHPGSSPGLGIQPSPAKCGSTSRGQSGESASG